MFERETMTGLCDRLKAAPSKEAIESLLSEGKSFHFASGVTQRRWKRLATKRQLELDAPPKKKEVKGAK